MRYQAFKYLMG